MPQFDAELHLRLLGERGLVASADSQRHAHDAELSEVARALLAVGAIELADATEIVEGYELANGLRRGGGLWRHHHRPAPSASAAPEARRTVLCDATLERPSEEVRVRSVTLSASETRLSVVIRARSGAGLGSRSRRRAQFPPGAMFSYPISDDRGTTSTTGFTGGGSDQEWRGSLTASRPLAVDTAWIELDKTRIELIEAPGPCTVSVEPLSKEDIAHRYLWNWLAAAEQHGPPLALEPVLDALIGAGCLHPDDPQLAAMRLVDESRRPWGAHGRAPGPAPIEGAPREWQSFLHPRARRRGARGSIALSAITPVFDGITVMVDELTADEHGWRVEVDVTPGIAHGPFGASLEERRVAWWAVDDLDQHYLGHFGMSSGSPERSSGTIEFGPALDRAATTLTLLPTGPTERARIEFALDWSRR